MALQTYSSLSMIKSNTSSQSSLSKKPKLRNDQLINLCAKRVTVSINDNNDLALLKGGQVRTSRGANCMMGTSID